MRCLFVPSFVFLLCAPRAPAGDADADWQAIIALDAGPSRRATSPAQVQPLALEHLARQERALRAFLAAHGSDARSFEARLRLVRLLSLRADIKDGASVPREVPQLLAELERVATPEQRKEVEFARISHTMRTLRTPTTAQRDALLAAARAFQTAHPDDARLASLLTEVATLFDLQPKTRQALLLDAKPLAQDAELKTRIADDLRRIELLGQPVTLRFKPAGGGGFDVADYRGKLVLLVFFAGWSQPALEALDTIQRAAANFPKGSVQILGVSLDTKRERLVAIAEQKRITWPVACDGKGWESALVRPLGINALPTVWLLDREGKLRSLNALEGTAAQVRQLLGEQL